MINLEQSIKEMLEAALENGYPKMSARDTAEDLVHCSELSDYSVSEVEQIVRKIYNECN